MRYYVALLISGVIFTSCKNESKVQQEGEVVVEQTTVLGSEEQAVIQKANFQVEGMTCELGCAKLIESRLAGLSGVQDVRVDFETKTASVEFDDSKQSEESITKAVEKIANGIYTVVDMTIEK